MHSERLLLGIILLLSVNALKDKDEDRPYEFGFTIDGEQHRYEKKDINGIIQGEFGFITADGVYHVTVYATDENGSFKILSMKNLKVSEALQLDKAKFKPSPNQLSIPVEPLQAKESTLPPISKQSSQPIYDFSTASTIGHGCSGCGIPPPTTGAPQPFQFQNPAFQDPSKLGIPLTSKPILASYAGSNRDTHPNTIKDYETPKHTVPLALAISSEPPKQIPILRPNEIKQNAGFIGKKDQVTLIKPLKQINPQNSIPKQQSIISQVSVADGMITIPGHNSIAIKDKYPNMIDGLPTGISEKDITDLLYKFNYTLGFHGHYEKGWKNGTKIGGYFVNGRDGISRVVTYIADENGYRPKVRFINIGLDSGDTPKPESEKQYGLKSFEFVWYPLKS